MLTGTYQQLESQKPISRDSMNSQDFLDKKMSRNFNGIQPSPYIIENERLYVLTSIQWNNGLCMEIRKMDATHQALIELIKNNHLEKYVTSPIDHICIRHGNVEQYP